MKKQPAALSTAILAAIMVVFCGSSPAFPKSIIIDTSFRESGIGLFIDYCEDRDHALALKDVAAASFENRWVPSKKESPGFGFTPSVYWVRFTVENRAAEEIEFYLEEKFPLIHDLRLYVPDRGGFRTVETGFLRPFRERPIMHRTFVFPIQQGAGSAKTYYMRFQSESAMNLALAVWSPREFRHYATREYWIYMLFYGMIVVMILYNLLLFFIIRWPEYLFYTVFILCLMLFFMTQNGMSYQFLYPDHPKFASLFIPVILSLATIFGLLFGGSYFRKDMQAMPLMARLKNVLLFLSIAWLVPCVIVSYRIAIVGTDVILVMSIAYAVVIGTTASLKKMRDGYFFLISWMLLLLGGFTYFLTMIGVFPITIATTWSMQIGCVAMVVLFSLAFSDRVNILRKDFKELSENLEVKVIARTEELQSAMGELEAMNDQLIQTRDSLWGEMQLAKKIQTILVPTKPAIPGYEICAYMNPAEEVGGDYYDIVNAGGFDWLIIGDVSGHGVPAGLVMMMVQTSVRVVLNNIPDIPPSKLLEMINYTIAENIRMLNDDKYMTIMALAAHRDGTFLFSGLHQNILVYRSESGTVEKSETRGMWIGMLDTISGMLYDDTLKIGSGDVILLFTDGITEARRKGLTPGKPISETDMFGEERLRDVLARMGTRPPGEIKNEILGALDGYRCADDVTLLVVKKL